jgi:hypothetical protein
MRKLILASSTALATALTLSSTTWAWFKMNSRATVENFDFEVVGGNGFKVSIDGENYYNDLSNLQIKKAIARDYGAGTYEILPFTNYGKEDQSKKADCFYKISYDNDMNKIYTELTGDDLTNELDKIMNEKILIWPVTTTNGRDFKTLSSGDTTYSASSGHYTQFSVYFKPESDNIKDNLTYDVYMTGYEGKNTAGDNIVPTLLTSQVRSIKLNAGLTAYENGQIVNYNSGQRINVYTSNSTRISSTVSNLESVKAGFYETTDIKFKEDKKYYQKDNDEDPNEVPHEVEVEVGELIDGGIYYEWRDLTYVYNVDESSSLIYEINDTSNGDKNLGSYATDYVGKYIKTSDETYQQGKVYFTFEYKLFEGTEFVPGTTYYVNDGTEYVVTEDEEPISGKNYYTYEVVEFTGDSFVDGIEYYEFNNDGYYMYNSDINAMYTYYNKLVSTERQLKALSYDDLPTNIINQLPKKDSSELESVENASDADADHYKKMVTLKSGDQAKYLTFRVWLEGWDADNIDGLANPIDVRLSFASKRIYPKEGND